jgi:drug/metabolite transporter (DMT)-like permease
VTAVLLATAAAASFGAMTVAIRIGLRDGGGALRASLATLTISFAVTFAASLVRHDYTAAWKFFLAGLLAPGLSQILFTRSVKEVGASRTSVTVGAAPLFALAIAFTLLDEPADWHLIAGALAIVAGGTLLVAERDRPGHLRARGLVLALMAAILFAVRDNIVRALHAHGSPETVAAATMLAGVLVGIASARGLPSRRELRLLAPAGALFGFSYICLFEAYFIGRVSIVSPLIATESLWGVGLAAILLGSSEAVGWRVILGAVAIVGGGVLIALTATTENLL